jgi:outer membrane autotransporter protein
MNRISLLFVIGSLTGLHFAHAQSASATEAEEHFYATATAGFARQSDQRIDYTLGAQSGSVDAPLGNGLLVGGTVGRRFANGWRTELEFMYQSVDRDALTLPNTGITGDGNHASTSIALNALYEFDLFGSPRVRTYVGAGLVYLTEVDIDFEAAGVERSFSGDDTGWQVLAGARYDVSERLFFDVGVRYLAASGVEFKGEEGAVGTLVSDYEPLAISASIGWRF